MSEGVEILISADDQASKVLAKVGDNVESKVKQIKEVSRGAKASTEFVGTLANSLGGSVIGSYASGIAQLTERIGNFSEVSKAGAGGALAFKAGLAGVALVAGYKVGVAIGDWVFQTKKWKDQIAEANKLLKESANTISRIDSIKISFRSEKAELQGEVAQRQLLNQLASEAAKLEDKIAATKAKQVKESAGIVGWAQYLAGSSEVIAESNKNELAASEQKLESIKKETQALQEKLSPYRQEVEILKDSMALKKRNDDYIKSLTEEVTLLKASKEEHAAIEAMQRTGGDAIAAKKAAALIRERDLLREKVEEEKKLEQKEDRGSGKPDLNVVQSRLLTRGKTDSGIDKVAKNTEEANRHLQRIYEKLPLSTADSLVLEYQS